MSVHPLSMDRFRFPGCLGTIGGDKGLFGWRMHDDTQLPPSDSANRLGSLVFRAWVRGIAIMMFPYALGAEGLG